MNMIIYKKSYIWIYSELFSLMCSYYLEFRSGLFNQALTLIVSVSRVFHNTNVSLLLYKPTQTSVIKATNI